jgi:hypothetical protein
MSFLRTDYSNTGDFSALPIGEYECFITKVTMKTTKETNKQMLNLQLTIRDDVEQAGQKRNFFDNLVVQDNMMWKFNQVAKAVELDEGTDLATPEDFAAAILYKAVRIKNKHRIYEGETQDTIATYKVSNTGGSATGGDPFAGGGSIDIGDDDLPF